MIKAAQPYFGRESGPVRDVNIKGTAIAGELKVVDSPSPPANPADKEPKQKPQTK